MWFRHRTETKGVRWNSEESCTCKCKKRTVKFSSTEMKFENSKPSKYRTIFRKCSSTLGPFEVDGSPRHHEDATQLTEVFQVRTFDWRKIVIALRDPYQQTTQHVRARYFILRGNDFSYEEFFKNTIAISNNKLLGF